MIGPGVAWARVILMAVLCLATSVPLRAQGGRSDVGREFVHALSDIAHTGVAPLRADRHDWLAFSTAAAGVLVLLPVDDNLDRWVVRNQRASVIRLVSPFRRSNEFGSSLAADSKLLPAAGLVIAAGVVAGNHAVRDAGFGCLSSSVVSSLLRSALYAGVSRTRPLAAEGDQFTFDMPGGEYNEHSFFSGHTMNAFGCVTYLNTRFEMGVVEPALYALAGAMSFARIADRYHWSSDVYAGSLVGFVVGRSLAKRALQRESRKTAGSSAGVRGASERLYLSPTPNGLSLAWQANFR